MGLDDPLALICVEAIDEYLAALGACKYVLGGEGECENGRLMAHSVGEVWGAPLQRRPLGVLVYGAVVWKRTCHGELSALFSAILLLHLYIVACGLALAAATMTTKAPRPLLALASGPMMSRVGSVRSTLTSTLQRLQIPHVRACQRTLNSSDTVGDILGRD